MEESKRKQVDYIEEVVCNIIGIDIQKVINKDKSQVPTLARKMIWYVLHVDYGYSGSIIADIYIRNVRGLWQQIADIKYKINHCKFYSDLYGKIKERLSDK